MRPPNKWSSLVFLQTLSAIFAQNFPGFCLDICGFYPDFAQIFRDFAQIFRVFAQIFKDFARIFNKSQLLGMRLHHASYTTTKTPEHHFWLRPRHCPAFSTFAQLFSFKWENFTLAASFFWSTNMHLFLFVVLVENQFFLRFTRREWLGNNPWRKKTAKKSFKTWPG